MALLDNSIIPFGYVDCYAKKILIFYPPLKKPDNLYYHNPGRNAIWYHNRLKRWSFGLIQALGIEKLAIYTEERVASPHLAQNWNYNERRQVKSDDISVDVVIEPGT